MWLCVLWCVVFVSVFFYVFYVEMMWLVLIDV